jgi:UDP-3-O-[3-hydroxymyristoyl] glucosamine N-acyltransferase
MVPPGRTGPWRTRCCLLTAFAAAALPLPTKPEMRILTQVSAPIRGMLDHGVNAGAQVSSSAVIGRGSQIDAGAIIGRDVKVGEGCHVGYHAVLGAGVVVGNDCRIGAHTTISNALIGERVEIASCVSIGGQGFGFVTGPTSLLRMPQVGRVIVEDDVEIGANCAIDRER